MASCVFRGPASLVAAPPHCVHPRPSVVELAVRFLFPRPVPLNIGYWILKSLAPRSKQENRKCAGTQEKVWDRQGRCALPSGQNPVHPGNPVIRSKILVHGSRWPVSGPRSSDLGPRPRPEPVEGPPSVLLPINFLLFMHVYRSNTLPTFKLRCSFSWASQTKTLMATRNTKRHKD